MSAIDDLTKMLREQVPNGPNRNKILKAVQAVMQEKEDEDRTLLEIAGLLTSMTVVVDGIGSSKWRIRLLKADANG